MSKPFSLVSVSSLNVPVLPLALISPAPAPRCVYCGEDVQGGECGASCWQADADILGEQRYSLTEDWCSLFALYVPRPGIGEDANEFAGPRGPVRAEHVENYPSFGEAERAARQSFGAEDLEGLPILCYELRRYAGGISLLGTPLGEAYETVAEWLPEITAPRWDEIDGPVAYGRVVAAW